jgi:hypothetical protein
LLAEKSLSGKLNPTSVYLELLARNIDTGLVEMKDEADTLPLLAFSAHVPFALGGNV